MSYLDNVKGFGARGLHAGLGTMNGFQKFILRGNVVDLAVGIVIGAAFNTVIQAFVSDLITPLIGVFGGFDFPNWAYKWNNSIFRVGAFLNAIISFIIIALVIYFFVVLPINKLTDRVNGSRQQKEEAPKTKDCPYCLSTIPLQATRCAYCTAQLPPADAPAVQPAR